MCLALLKILAIILVGTAMTVYIFFAPHYASELSYHGETASIRRDANNIPTITASSRTSYMYAIGRVHAEDRLFQMSFKRLVVQGRLAEYLGEKPLPMDKFMRELNLKGWGQRMAERLQRENITEY
jgi:penicillin amidase